MKSKIPSSRAQRKLCKKLGGVLNQPICGYYADIVLPGKIIVEYDGGGHDLLVKMGQLTRKEFAAKELVRESVLIKEGYKLLRIVNDLDFILTDKDMAKVRGALFTLGKASLTKLTINLRCIYGQENQDRGAKTR